MKGYHKSTGPARCAIKVDLMKAYDSVQWDFVEATLIKMGFPRTVIDWIIVCVTSCQFSINVCLTAFYDRLVLNRKCTSVRCRN